MAIKLGNDLPELIMGTVEDDTLSGGGGDDTIIGGPGNDTILDGAGLDSLFGGPGDDLFILSDSNLVPATTLPVSPIGGPVGGAQIFGGSGSDAVDASGSNEKLELSAIAFQNASVESVTGSPFADVIDGSTVTSNLVLRGGEGDDTLIGSGGDDLLEGGPGADFLNGGQAVSSPAVYATAPFLMPGIQPTELASQSTNQDTFVLSALTDSLFPTFDTIAAFEMGKDVIDAPTAVASENIAQLGELLTLDQASISELLPPKAFPALGAAIFAFQEQTLLAINDGVAGFDATQDAVLNITNYSGSLTDLTIV